MERLNFFFPGRQAEGLRSLAHQTELSSSELLRRMVDYCLKGNVLNELVPQLSGNISLSIVPSTNGEVS